MIRTNIPDEAERMTGTIMAEKTLKERVAALEAEVARLKEKIEGPEIPWTEKIAGTFANDPDFEEAMRLGREWRESFRPGAKKRKRGGRRTRTRSRKSASS
jgi:hypothetical protein